MSYESDGSAKSALDHAWNWFALHAGQRMQSFNFFLIATAFLVAAYATVLKEYREVAAAIGLLGAWISFWFNRLEHRTKQLVKAGEKALAPSQERLAAVTDIESLRIVVAVDEKAPGSSSYAKVIDMIQWTIFVAFLAGAVYALSVSALVVHPDRAGGMAERITNALSRMRLSTLSDPRVWFTVGLTLDLVGAGCLLWPVLRLSRSAIAAQTSLFWRADTDAAALLEQRKCTAIGGAFLLAGAIVQMLAVWLPRVLP